MDVECRLDNILQRLEKAVSLFICVANKRPRYICIRVCFTRIYTCMLRISFTLTRLVPAERHTQGLSNDPRAQEQLAFR